MIAQIIVGISILAIGAILITLSLIVIEIIMKIGMALFEILNI